MGACARTLRFRCRNNCSPVALQRAAEARIELGDDETFSTQHVLGNKRHRFRV
jgi:hypothetical protein